jgi:hypothetical protein
VTSALVVGERSASRPYPFTPGERATGTHCIGVGLRACMDDMKKRKFVILPELYLRPLGHPACSQSLYRLPCRGWSFNRHSRRPPSFECIFCLITGYVVLHRTSELGMRFAASRIRLIRIWIMFTFLSRTLFFMQPLMWESSGVKSVDLGGHL